MAFHAVLMTSNIMDDIIAVIPTIFTSMSTVITSLVNNPLFCFLFGCGIVRVLMSLVKKAKKTTR